MSQVCECEGTFQPYIAPFCSQAAESGENFSIGQTPGTHLSYVFLQMLPLVSSVSGKRWLVSNGSAKMDVSTEEKIQLDSQMDCAFPCVAKSWYVTCFLRGHPKRRYSPTTKSRGTFPFPGILLSSKPPETQGKRPVFGKSDG